MFNDERLPKRFWDKVSVQETGCWEWNASVSNQTGYGWFNLSGKAENAHRVSCRAFHGDPPSPDRKVAMHSCDNRVCVNPDHLSWGTMADNLRDAREKGRLVPGLAQRSKTHCLRGHEYTKVNTYITRTGSRSCRECYRQHWRDWNKRRKEPGYKRLEERE